MRAWFDIEKLMFYKKASKHKSYYFKINFNQNQFNLKSTLLPYIQTHLEFQNLK